MMNDTRGKGVGSRLAVATSDLPDGWRLERRSAKSCVWIDDRGKRYKSSKDVEAAMQKRGLWKGAGYQSVTATETDTASEYEPSPVKKPRTDKEPGPR